MNDLNPVSSSVRRSLLALSTCVVPTSDAVFWPDRNALYWPDGLDVWVRDGQSPFQHVARLTCSADSGVPGEMEWYASVNSKEKLPDRMNSESMREFTWRITLQVHSVLTVTLLQWSSLDPTDEDETGCFVGYVDWMFRTSLALEIYVQVETGTDDGTKKYPGCAHDFKSLRAAESCGITFRLDIPWDDGSASSGNASEYALFFASQCRRWAHRRLEEMDARFPVSVGYFRVVLFALTPSRASSRARATSCMVSSVHLVVVAHMVLSSIDRGNDSLFDELDRVMQRAVDRALEIGAPPQDDAVAQNALRAARILNGTEKPMEDLHAPMHAAELAVMGDFSEPLRAMVAGASSNDTDSGHDDSTRHAVHQLLQLEQQKLKSWTRNGSAPSCLSRMSVPHRTLVLKRIATFLGVGYRGAVNAWYEANAS
tara:strand:+ start:723 stop:2003 length:1281 start_codon:yes stop_codon:yes gene_type:complete